MQLEQNGVLFSGCFFTSVNLQLTSDIADTLVKIVITNENTNRTVNTTVNEISEGEFKTPSMRFESFQDFGAYHCIIWDNKFTRKNVLSKKASLNETLHPDFKCKHGICILLHSV